MVPIKIDVIEGIQVVRDDLVPGGTKARVLPVLLQGGTEFVYASPAYGYAQVALAVCCRALGLRATVFTAQRKVMHPRTAEAYAAGAAIHLVPHGYMSVVRARARDYCETTGAVLLPFGLDDERFIDALAGEAARVDAPDEAWCVAGSGVLARALHRAWPATRLYAVRIGAEPHLLDAVSGLYLAPERFEDDAKAPPPFPSCPNYDAKAWRFIKAHAAPGALFWNVAG
jgi:hypothetical protein